MPDHIRYDLLAQQALRGVVRSVLADAAKKGLPGDHHFYISFDTQAAGVRLSERLRAQYPEEMTIILQHQFWDLSVTEQGFEVRLSFGGVMEKLGVPFDAVNRFVDPSVQFGLEFAEVTEEADDGEQPAATLQTKMQTKAQLKALETAQEENRETSQDKTQARPARKTRVPSIPQAVPTPEPPAASADEPGPDKPAGGGEVVRLDRFRKK